MRSLASLLSATGLRGLLALAAAALLVQALLVTNPGYFSHDELQWAARASAGVTAGWTDIDALQYRPLTFELWMALSRAFFDTPSLFHLAFALLGICNVLLLWSVLRSAGFHPGTAHVAALAFAASPYAMYVHGWVGTLGDLLWVACALGIGAIALRGHMRATAFATLALTGAALLAKEAALSIPAAAVVLALLDASRRRTWSTVAALAGAVALAYIVVRYPALATPRAGEPYAWSITNVPLRWLEYQLYPAHPRVFEVHNVLDRYRLAALAALFWMGATAALARRGRRWLAAWLLGGVATLGPVLVLGQAATQYGYGFAAWCTGLAGLAWPGLTRWGRIAVGTFAVVSALHGLVVARQMHRVGQVEATFSHAVLQALSASAAPLRLSPEHDAEAWIFQRVTHEVPTYRDHVFSPRIRLLAAGEPADYRIRADGRLVPDR